MIDGPFCKFQKVFNEIQMYHCIYIVVRQYVCCALPHFESVVSNIIIIIN